MEYQRVATGYQIRLERGEDVFEVLPRFCKEHNVSAAALSGLGAVKGITCGHYDLEKKKYILQDYEELTELINLTGNVSLKDGEPMLHIHATFSDTTNNAFGGHVTRLVCGVTVEIHLIDHKDSLVREHDDFSGLHLLSLDETYA